MEIVSERKFTKVAPRKVRLITSAIKRTKDPKQALIILSFLPKIAAIPVRLALQTALADARNTFKVRSITLKNIIVNEGPRLKRSQPVSRGSAHPILKRTSHVRVILEGE